MKEADSFGYTDKEINAIDLIGDRDMNWFQILYRKGKKGKFIETADCEVYTFYGEAVKSGIKILKDDKFWKHFNP